MDRYTLFSTYSITIPFASIAKVEEAAVELYKVGDEAMAVDACQLLFGLAKALSHTVIGKSKLLFKAFQVSFPREDLKLEGLLTDQSQVE